MPTDPLAALRSLHLPDLPPAWPPAPGWWLLVLLLAGVVIWGVRYLYMWWRARAPLREARSLYLQTHDQLDSGTIDAVVYLNQTNEILKRLLVRSLGRAQLAAAHGQTWLAALDEIDGSAGFTSGAGRYLGDERFAPSPPDLDDARAIHPLILHLLKQVRP